MDEREEVPPDPEKAEKRRWLAYLVALVRAQKRAGLFRPVKDSQVEIRDDGDPLQ